MKYLIHFILARLEANYREAYYEAVREREFHIHFVTELLKKTQ